MRPDFFSAPVTGEFKVKRCEKNVSSLCVVLSGVILGSKQASLYLEAIRTTKHKLSEVKT